jgi:hypothetical protein
MGYRSAEEADRGYRGGACTDLHAAMLYLRDVDHKRVRGDVVRPVTASYGRLPRGASNGLRK